VITSGPYKFVRHPGYTAAIAMFIGIPLALAFLVGAAAGCVSDRAAGRANELGGSPAPGELCGYADYARRTRSRLLPGFW